MFHLYILEKQISIVYSFSTISNLARAALFSDQKHSHGDECVLRKYLIHAALPSMAKINIGTSACKHQQMHPWLEKPATTLSTKHSLHDIQSFHAC